jgi:hypothetical protein
MATSPHVHVTVMMRDDVARTLDATEAGEYGCME